MSVSKRYEDSDAEYTNRMPRLTLYPLSLEEALRRALIAPVPEKEPHKPGAGRKKKAPTE